MDDAFYYIVWGALVVPMAFLIYTQVRARAPTRSGGRRRPARSARFCPIPHCRGGTGPCTAPSAAAARPNPAMATAGQSRVPHRAQIG